MVKYVTLNEGELAGATHVVVKTSLSERGKERGGEEFVLIEWCQNRSISLDLPFWGEEKCIIILTVSLVILILMKRRKVSVLTCMQELFFDPFRECQSSL